ncbi:MAG TPA: heparan-alpha-glucosaminide N-acetyltransferase domain-containing protein [Candidatus Angelobacter sp.]|nr:heparan-alpha-glucosaminide N-acetyltransferase domain-containing protein [Candidatus Angelobacter sp.]
MANLVAATAAAQSTGKLEAPARIHSIDLIRGAVMVLMAIDHVRVYSGVPAGGPAPGVFFTRWITHFCAPAFIFLAGTSSFFYGRKHPGLSRFLLTRGAWLIFLELTVLRFAWTFNFDFRHYEMAGVLWAIGCCMIIMSVLVKLPVPAVGTIGLLIIAAHNLLDPFLRAILQGKAGNEVSALWKLAYVGFYAGPIHLGQLNFIVLYSIIPWIGVMAAGYAFGQILLLEPARRNRLCLMIGGSAIVLFLLLRGFNLYGDPFPWHHGARMPALLAFLNTTKYPASLNFLLMTLGPAITLVPLLQRANGVLARMITVFGRVPFFYYVLHIPLIHLLALLVSRIRFGAVDPWLFTNHPMGNPPPPSGYVWSLPLLYLIWAITIAVLYFPCKWFAAVKAARRSSWLQYF